MVYPQAERIPEGNYIDDTSDFGSLDNFDGVRTAINKNCSLLQTACYTNIQMSK